MKEGHTMKRTIITAALLLGTMLAAHAETSFWDDVTKQNRGDAQVLADGHYCDLQVGVEELGTAPTAVYRKCMLSRGWRYSHRRQDNTYINRRGMVCKPILNGGGTECSGI
jgi:hypothetical protein